MVTNCHYGDGRTSPARDMAAFDRLPPFCRELLRNSPVHTSAEDALVLVSDLKRAGHTDREIRAIMADAFAEMKLRVALADRAAMRTSKVRRAG